MYQIARNQWIKLISIELISLNMLQSNRNENEWCYTFFFLLLFSFPFFSSSLLLLNVPTLVNHSSMSRLYPFLMNFIAKSWIFLLIVCCSFATSKWICFRCCYCLFLVWWSSMFKALKWGIIFRQNMNKYCIVNALNKRSNKNEHYFIKVLERERERDAAWVEISAAKTSQRKK